MEKNAENDRTSLTTYVSKETKDRWTKHFEEMRPQYTSLSHMIEVNVDYGLKGDRDRLNIMFGKVGEKK